MTPETLKLLLIIISLIVLSFFTTVLAAAKETAIQEKKKLYQIVFKEIKDDFFLLVRTVFVHKFSVRTLKHVQQIGLYFIEIFTVCGFFLIVENFWNPINFNNFYYELFIRFLSVFTAYQIFVYSIMSLINSAKYDEWLALLRIAKLQKLYNKTKSQTVLNELDFRIRDSLNPYTFMTGKTRKFVEEIKEGVDESYLDYLIIISEHQVEALNSFWRFSILLNSIK